MESFGQKALERVTQSCQIPEDKIAEAGGDEYAYDSDFREDVLLETVQMNQTAFDEMNERLFLLQEQKQEIEESLSDAELKMDALPQMKHEQKEIHDLIIDLNIDLNDPRKPLSHDERTSKMLKIYDLEVRRKTLSMEIDRIPEVLNNAPHALLNIGKQIDELSDQIKSYYSEQNSFEKN